VGPRLVAALVVRNEADRYLRSVLDDLETYCDRICVLDDGSTDATPDVCARHPRVHLLRNEASLFWRDESALRRQLWAAAAGLDPEWILALDADEMLEERFKRERDRYLDQRRYPAVGARFHQFWGSTTHYRVDKAWNPAASCQPVLVRHMPGYPYRWPARRLHCGRVPQNVPGPMLCDGLRVKHFGYANPADHPRKHDLYVRHDPQGLYCLRAHYDSILDPPSQVRLEAWRE
jgi:glycosyltransferase involved in cell wall biosynthesis